jgi:hypothetical protein
MLYFGDTLRGMDLMLPLIIGIWPVIVFSAMAWFMDMPRLYAYGLVFGIAFTCPFHNAGWLVISLGGIAAVYGIYLLGTFVKQYPLPQPNGADGQV